MDLQAHEHQMEVFSNPGHRLKCEGWNGNDASGLDSGSSNQHSGPLLEEADLIFSFITSDLTA